jgi:hypothetical protein
MTLRCFYLSGTRSYRNPGAGGKYPSSPVGSLAPVYWWRSQWLRCTWKRKTFIQVFARQCYKSLFPPLCPVKVTHRKWVNDHVKVKPTGLQSSSTQGPIHYSEAQLVMEAPQLCNCKETTYSQFQSLCNHKHEWSVEIILDGANLNPYSTTNISCVPDSVSLQILEGSSDHLVLAAERRVI